MVQTNSHYSTASIKRIGVFGGTFDPVHLGHMGSAKALLIAQGLDEIYFMPCLQHPHDKRPMANAEQRLAMLNLAVQGQSSFHVDDRELARSGKSFTVDSLIDIREEVGEQAVLLFFLGSDAFAQFHRWQRWETIFSLANVAVIERANAQSVQAIEAVELKQKINQAVDFVDAPHGQITIASLSPYPVSSTLLREQLLQASTSSSLLTEFISPQVLDYIYQQDLYR
ncbi:MAG: nicotinate-nucleotide adenylyltransferase [Pseudomonadales bacterium]|nr:nicotinate-nucleotide adenylyltransferase [Pseudomonadales bacterium]